MDQVAVLEEEDAHHVAVHEAGHAVAGSVLGLGLEWVSVRPEGRVKGRAMIRSVSPKELAEGGPDIAKPYIIQGFAGPYAESRVNPHFAAHHGGSSDLEQVKGMAVDAVCGLAKSGDDVEPSAEECGRVFGLLNEAREGAKLLVTQNWLAILRIADMLLVYQFLKGADVDAIVADFSSEHQRSGREA